MTTRTDTFASTHLTPAQRRLIAAAIDHLDRATRHDREGLHLTASKASTVAAEIWTAAVELSLHHDPYSAANRLRELIADAGREAREAEESHRWHDAETYTIVADELGRELHRTVDAAEK